MKKFIDYLFIVLLVVLPFSITSCSDDDSDGGSSDYIEVTFNGKTYRESIPGFGYTIQNGTETDSEGRRITITRGAADSFSDKYGFTFMPEIAHFSNKADLMAAKPGTYLHKDDFWGNIWEGDTPVENFTLVTELEIFESDTYYELKNGQHQVTSIKEVGNNVQIEGTFNGTYYCDENNKQCEIQGKYRMTLNVNSGNNPLD